MLWVLFLYQISDTKKKRLLVQILKHPCAAQTFMLASSGSMMWRAGASFTVFFNSSKAFSSDYSHFQGYFYFPNSVRGAAILA